MSNDDETKKSPAVQTAAEKIEAREKSREAKRQALEDQRLAQRVVDLEALEALEDEHGVSNVVWMDLPFSPGLVSLAAARTPTPAQMKKYRDRCKAKGDKSPDYTAACEELAAQTRIYPPRDEAGNEAYRLLLEARPGLHVQLGVAALKLGGGVEQDESKS